MSRRAHLARLTILPLLYSFTNILSCSSEQQPETSVWRLINFDLDPGEGDGNHLAGHSLLSLWSRRREAAGVRRWKPRPTRANIGRAINHTLRPEVKNRCYWNCKLLFQLFPHQANNSIVPHPCRQLERVGQWGGESREGGRGSKIRRLQRPLSPEKSIRLPGNGGGKRCELRWIGFYTFNSIWYLGLSWLNNTASLQFDPKVDGWKGCKNQR